MPQNHQSIMNILSENNIEVILEDRIQYRKKLSDNELIGHHIKLLLAKEI